MAGIADLLPYMAQAARKMRGYHGSPQTNLTELLPSERGPLGPGVYLSPAEQVAQRYAGPGGRVYGVDLPEDALFHGMRPWQAGSDVNPYQIWRDQLDRMMGKVEPEYRAPVGELAEKFRPWPEDGYPFYKRLMNLYGGDEGAQALLRRSGFRGMTGNVDGPEIVMFGKKPLEIPSFGSLLPEGM